MRGLTLLTASLAATSLAQFVYPPDESVFTRVDGPLEIKVRYKQVLTGPEGFCELYSNVTAYSGFVEVAEHEHYHFIFFGSRLTKPEDSHLTAWISGGPGASSMSELFTEHGPCRITIKQKPTNNPYSWNTNSNVVYIDQPTTVGFSYTIPIPAHLGQELCGVHPLPNYTCPADLLDKKQECYQYGPSVCGTFSDKDPAYTSNSTENAAPKFWRALQGVYAAFPEYTKHGFTLGSESYGGHYAPVFSRYIANQNKNLPDGAYHIDQQSVQVNNGWFSPLIAYGSFWEFLANGGNTYGLSIPEAASKRMHYHTYGKDQCLDGIRKCNSASGSDLICRHWDNFCTEHVQSFLYRELHRDTYNTRMRNPDPFPNGWYVEYLNQPHVIKELAVYTNYTDQSVEVGRQFDLTGDDAKELGIIDALVDLLDSGVSVTLLHGDADYDCNWLGGRKVAEMIAKRSTTAGLTADYANAGFENLTTSDGIVHGQVKQVGRLSFVRVYESGHQVGFYQPLAEQAIYQRTIGGLDIATGTVNVTAPVDGSLYRSTGPLASSFYEGNATVQFHVTPESAVYNYTSNEPTLHYGIGTSSNIDGKIVE